MRQEITIISVKCQTPRTKSWKDSSSVSCSKWTQLRRNWICCLRTEAKQKTRMSWCIWMRDSNSLQSWMMSNVNKFQRKLLWIGSTRRIWWVPFCFLTIKISYLTRFQQAFMSTQAKLSLEDLFSVDFLLKSNHSGACGLRNLETLVPYNEIYLCKDPF